MPEHSWRDRIVGARMTVDDEFADRVEQSSFSRQQWGLVMTATQFEIEDPEDPEAARIVANTDQLESVLPELDKIEEQMRGVGGGSGSGVSAGGAGGLLGGIKDALGIGGGGGGVDESRKTEATRLVEAYAEELQRHLEERGRWDELREMAAEEA